MGNCELGKTNGIQKSRRQLPRIFQGFRVENETKLVNAKPIEAKQCATCNRIFATEANFLTGTSRWRICDRKNLWFNCGCGSTLMIVKGKFDWYSPDKAMSSGAAGLFNKIGGLKELPHVPLSVMEIQEALQSPNLDVPSLSKKVKQDPLLAARLLEIANNMKAARDPKDRKKIAGLEHAIAYIGKKAFSELVMMISLQSFSAKTTLFNSDRFWQESFVVAELAELISAKWGGDIIKDEVFVSAALCNIGKIVGAIALPENTDKIGAMVNSPKTLCTWPQAEAILKVPNHALLGEIGGAIWGLPKYVLDAIASHHGPLLAPTPGQKRMDGKLKLSECVALANQLSHWILLRPSRMDQNAVDNICQTANISPKDLEIFAELHSGLSKRAA